MTNTVRKLNTVRIAIVIMAITLWSVFILIRLVQLQVFKHESFARLANQGQQVKRAILAPRGIIYDSHMDELATSVTVSTAVAEPHRIEETPTTARKLADILKLNPQKLLKVFHDRQAEDRSGSGKTH